MSRAYPQPRTSRVRPGRSSPVRIRALAGSVSQICTDHLVVLTIVVLRVGVAAECPGSPVLLMVIVTHADRVAGPDHELVALRGLQPAAVALAGGLAAGIDVADGRTLHRLRVRDVLLRPVLPGRSGSCASCRQRRPGLVRLAAPADQPGALIILPIGFVFDAMLEITLVRTGLYIYSQVIPFGSIFVGEPFQFPLIWESLMVTFVMIPAGVLLYRDDTGRTVAEKLAQRARIFASRPALGMFVVMFVIINLAYFAYGTGFAIIKWTRTATSVACPWPYPEAKVYDPQGFYEENGQPGPVLGRHLVDLDERPARRAARRAAAAPKSDRCAPRTQNG